MQEMYLEYLNPIFLFLEDFNSNTLLILLCKYNRAERKWCLYDLIYEEPDDSFRI